MIRAAVSGRPYLQAVTDQGTPYRAAQARAIYEDLGLESVPTKEGAPTRKATLERSFGLVKQILNPMISLTSSLVTTILEQKPSGEIGRDRAYRWSLVPLLQSDEYATGSKNRKSAKIRGSQSRSRSA